MPTTPNRNLFQKTKDFLTFPFRALCLFEEDKWGLSSLATERFDYVSREVKGYCLDVGCGRDNLFIRRFLQGNGKGIDVYPYKGLRKEEVFPDLSTFPFPNDTFSTITFIANFNHIPRPLRDKELNEANRCLKKGGNVVITALTPMASRMVHGWVALVDKWFGTHYDLDSERGMEADEDLFVSSQEVMERLKKAGFEKILSKLFITQWGLNRLYIGWKSFD